MSRQSMIGGTVICDREDDVAAGNAHSRHEPAIKEALEQLCSAPFVVPAAPVASELIARHEHAAAAMCQTVADLLLKLADLDPDTAD